MSEREEHDTWVHGNEGGPYRLEYEDCAVRYDSYWSVGQGQFWVLKEDKKRLDNLESEVKQKQAKLQKIAVERYEESFVSHVLGLRNRTEMKYALHTAGIGFFKKAKDNPSYVEQVVRESIRARPREAFGELRVQNSEVSGIMAESGVVADDFLRSRSNRQVLAAGDADGRMQLSPVASYEGRVAARNFLEGDVERICYDSIPSIVFTVPPVAMVGWTEAAAREQGHNVSTVTSDMKDWNVFTIAGEPVAKAKVVIDSRSGRVLGAHLFGRGAEEDIHIFVMAIRFGISADELRSMVYGYPSFASALPYTLPQVETKQELRKAG